LRKKTQIDPNALMPKLPDPKELKPFPSLEAMSFVGKGADRGVGHKSRVVAVSAEVNGLYLASGDETGNVIVWDVFTGRVLKQYAFNELVHDVQWNRNKDVQLLAVALDSDQVVMLNPGLQPIEQGKSTDQLLLGYQKTHKLNAEQEAIVEQEEPVGIAIHLLVVEEKGDEEESKKDTEKAKAKSKSKGKKKKVLTKWEYWEIETEEYRTQGKRLSVKLEVVPKKLVWHMKGDYFATVAEFTQTSSQVIIHSLSKSKSQVPFAKSKGIVECVEFHPERPYFFVATRRSVFVYNLQKQVLIKKFESPAQWISSIAIHPKGDNFIVGTYDKRILWYDMDLGTQPYKVLKYSDKAVRRVDFHPRYPLFASASDDGSVYIFHGMVYDDLAQNALILPLKLLQGHKVVKGLGSLIHLHRL
jgi:ribosome biogenesis protein ERB1